MPRFLRLNTARRDVRLLRLAQFGALLLLHALASTAAPRQDLRQLERLAEAFALAQAQALGSEFGAQVEARARALDDRLILPRCDAPQTFLPPGARLAAWIAIGVRCPNRWSIQVNVALAAPLLVVQARRPLGSGETVTESDVAAVEINAFDAPVNAIRRREDAVGKVVAQAVAAGITLRKETLRAEFAVRQGQVVKLIAFGDGFQVTNHGRAMFDAGPGQSVSVRVLSGQVVSGVARPGGVVEVGG
jgi:flagella basal body P-ring formation protein FlgA